MSDLGCTVLDDALSPSRVAALRDAVLGHDGLRDSQLAGTFGHTRGFGLIFRAGERDALCDRNPWAAPFVDLALAAAPDDANAWYLNALLVPAGGAVGPHLDSTLREPSGEDDVIALRVSVLYLTDPDSQGDGDGGDEPGGRLRLSRDGHVLGEIEPRAGRLVSFDGRLVHEVTARRDTAQGQRLSLVLEHYALPAQALARLSCRLVVGAAAATDPPLWAGGRPRSFAAVLAGRGGESPTGYARRR
jgi:hypothetical protein